MSFLFPQALLFLLLIPLLAKLFWLPGHRLLNALRVVAALLLIALLARPRLDKTTSGSDVYLLLDRSISVGTQGQVDQAEILRLVESSSQRKSEDRLAIVSYGEGARLDQRPTRGLVSLPNQSNVGEHGSRLSDALQLVAEQTDPGRHTRVLLLTDGITTGVDPRNREVLSGVGKLPLWYRQVGQQRSVDVAAGEIILPHQVATGTGFWVQFTMSSSVDTTVQYKLLRQNQVIAAGQKQLRAGDNNFFARDIAGQPGIWEYELVLEAATDTVPENNRARALLHIEAGPRALLVSEMAAGGLLQQSLEQAGIPLDLVSAQTMAQKGSAAELAPYKVVILENLPLDAIGPAGVGNLTQAVKSGITGLIVIGGQQSLGPGGYHNSPLDPLLPVSMQLREEQRRGMFALTAALDRSGSMSVPVNSNSTKMDLANHGVAEAIRLLSPLDQISVIAVDEAPHVIIPLSRAEHTTGLIQAVKRIESMGGGIYVHTALEAAAKEIRKSPIANRHILLFADASDAEQQEGCIPLVKQLHKEGIATSVIGLGTRRDSDAKFLVRLSRNGGGKIHFTNRPGDLPRIFSQEVIRISRRGFVEEPTATKWLADATQLSLPLDQPPPPTSGYNLTSLKKGASCALITEDDYQAPLIAFWQQGRTATGVLTAALDGPKAKPFAGWSGTPELLVNLVRRIAAGVQIGHLKAYSRFNQGQATVQLEVDEEKAVAMRAALSTVRFLPPDGTTPMDVPLQWESPTVAVAHAPLGRPGHYLPIVDLGSQGVLKAPSLSVPYSPEYMLIKENKGRQLLQELAAATGGKELNRADQIWSVEPDTLIRQTEPKEITQWLALALLLCLLLEIAERRIGLFRRN